MADRNRVVVTPGQAQWIVEKMISERRISAADVRGLLADMGREIADLEHRLDALREIGGTTPSASTKPREAARARRMTKRTRGTKRSSSHARGIVGTLTVLLRSIPPAQHAAIQAIREKKGIRAAIKAAKAAVKT